MRSDFPPRDRLYDSCGPLAAVGAFARALATALPISRGLRVADAPCGNALLSLELLRCGLRPQPVDPDAALRQTARDRLHGKRVLEGDLTDLPFEDASVDGVASLFGLCGLAKATRAAALRETARVLKPEGAFVFGEIAALQPENPPHAQAVDIQKFATDAAALGFRLRLRQFSDAQWLLIGMRREHSRDDERMAITEDE